MSGCKSEARPRFCVWPPPTAGAAVLSGGSEPLFGANYPRRRQALVSPDMIWTDATASCAVEFEPRNLRGLRRREPRGRSEASRAAVAFGTPKVLVLCVLCKPTLPRQHPLQAAKLRVRSLRPEPTDVLTRRAPAVEGTSATSRTSWESSIQPRPSLSSSAHFSDGGTVCLRALASFIVWQGMREPTPSL